MRIVSNRFTTLILRNTLPRNFSSAAEPALSFKSLAPRGDSAAHLIQALDPSREIPTTTPLLSLQPLPLAALRNNKEFEVLYSSKLQSFNKIQIQVFQVCTTRMTTSSSVHLLVAAKPYALNLLC
jgi:hypothetical protein